MSVYSDSVVCAFDAFGFYSNKLVLQLLGSKPEEEKAIYLWLLSFLCTGFIKKSLSRDNEG